MGHLCNGCYAVPRFFALGSVGLVVWTDDTRGEDYLSATNRSGPGKQGPSGTTTETHTQTLGSSLLGLTSITTFFSGSDMDTPPCKFEGI